MSSDESSDSDFNDAAAAANKKKVGRTCFLRCSATLCTYLLAYPLSCRHLQSKPRSKSNASIVRAKGNAPLASAGSASSNFKNNSKPTTAIINTNASNSGGGGGGGVIKQKSNSTTNKKKLPPAHDDSDDSDDDDDDDDNYYNNNNHDDDDNDDDDDDGKGNATIAVRAQSPAVKQSPKKKKKTIEEEYQKLDQIDHALKRPEMYIGTIQMISQEMWVYDKGVGMNLRKINFVPGLHKIFDEILVNAADNKQRDSSMQYIKVEIDATENSVTVTNDGRGMKD